MIDQAGTGLRQLLLVPFNLRLVGELLAEGVPAAELTPVRTQLELLDRYWEVRVIRGDVLGDAREVVLRRAAEAMVRRRSLRAERAAVATDPAASGPLNQVLSSGVLVEWQPLPGVRPDRYVLAFAHHMLYDYGVARLLFRGPDERLVERLEAEPDLALATRPSLVLHFLYLWEADGAGAILAARPAHRAFGVHSPGGEGHRPLGRGRAPRRGH